MILNFYGESNSGKTTLIQRLIGELKGKGYKVGTVKNIHMENFTIDTEEKDTWKYTKAGAEVVVARSKNEVAFLVNHDISPKDVALFMEKISDFDIIIVEGYWDDDAPKIAVGEIEEKPNTVFRFKDNFDEVMRFAVEGIEVDKVHKKLPGLDCGKCGYKGCIELAGAILKDENTLEDCHYFSKKRVSLKVDGKEIPLGRFAKDMVAGTVGGMVSTLKGVEDGKNIRIEIEI